MYGCENCQKWHPDARSAKTGSGNMAEITGINRAYATSYLCSVVTMAVPFLRYSVIMVPENAIFGVFWAPWGRTPLKFPNNLRRGKTIWWGYQALKFFLR